MTWSDQGSGAGYTNYGFAILPSALNGIRPQGNGFVSDSGEVPGSEDVRTYSNYRWVNLGHGVALMYPNSPQGKAYVLALPIGGNWSDDPRDLITKTYGQPTATQGSSLWWETNRPGVYLKHSFDDSGRVTDVDIVTSLPQPAATAAPAPQGNYAYRVGFGSVNNHAIGEAHGGEWPELSMPALDSCSGASLPDGTTGSFYQDRLVGIYGQYPVDPASVLIADTLPLNSTVEQFRAAFPAAQPTNYYGGYQLMIPSPNHADGWISVAFENGRGYAFRSGDKTYAFAMEGCGR
ncbi:hypothetical protein CAQU_02695 [Corynebacterium aquilae DSM 44791]|uniref:Uncharacterized protein n=1 Tax=Corynebacterium aquilae DSM 44791 TaxID=1431546 RepID=A0A1L7CE90_9CORY|nr:hypothetical protein CAQU_02695 [Corynebacterium aquilae DSM 44791]